jgi:putative DNA primase/helicase
MTAAPDLSAVVSRLGGDLYQGGTAALVPAPGHSRRDRSLSLRLVDGGRRLLWHAFTEAKAGEVWAHLGLERGFIREETPAEWRRRQEAERRERARKLGFCGDLWRQTVAASGTAVEAYLRGRGITGSIPPSLRFHAAAPTSYPWNTPQGGPVRTFPAMVAVATGEDGKSAAGIHVTFLASNGSGKAGLRSPRRMFGDLAGAVVQLAPFPVGEVLAVAEGIETALAYSTLHGVPTWAALSTSGLRRLVPPHGLSRLIVAADRDDGGEGLAAARVCAERATRRCEVSIDPAPEGLDWADVIWRKIQ